MQILKPHESPAAPLAKKCLSFSGTLPSVLEGKEATRFEKTRNTSVRQSMRQSSTAPFTLMHEIRKLEHLQEQLGEEANRALEVLQKEVACHRQGNQDAAETIAKLQAEIRDMCAVRPTQKEVNVDHMVPVNKSVGANLKDEITRLHSQGSNIANLEEQLENVQKSIDKLIMSLPNNNNEQVKSQSKKKNKSMGPLTSSNAVNKPSFLRSPCSPMSSTREVMEGDTENRAPEEAVSEKETPKGEEGGDVSSKENTPYRRSSSVNMRKMQKMFQNAAEENVRSIRTYVTELKERVAKLQYQKQLLVCQVTIHRLSYIPFTF